MSTILHKDLTGGDLHNPKPDGSVNPTNLLSNGDFEVWTAGTSAAPDGWTLAGAAATVAQEATIIKLGTYSTKVTRVGNDCTIKQSIHTIKGINYWKGRTVTFGCWVYATVADRGFIQIFDGVGTTNSSKHTGDSTWQLLTVTRTIDSSATELTPYCYIVDGNTSAYFDGAMCVEGESAFAFSPDTTSGTGANQLVRLNGSSQLPAVSGALLTNLPVSDTNTSNVLWQWHGSNASSGAGHGHNGIYNGSALIYQIYMVNQETGYPDDGNRCFATKFKKVAGISTVTVYVYLAGQAYDGYNHCGCTVTVGGISYEFLNDTTTTATWYSNDFDVSSLTNGTVYDVDYQLKGPVVVAPGKTRLYDTIAFGS
jgi:hypothetical protein